jgi:hypothetical protein
VSGPGGPWLRIEGKEKSVTLPPFKGECLHKHISNKKRIKEILVQGLEKNCHALYKDGIRIWDAGQCGRR